MGDQNNPKQNASDSSPKLPPTSALPNEGDLREADGQEKQDQIEETKALIRGARQGGNRKTKPVEWLQFAVNVILAMAGIIAIFIYGGQLAAMNSTLREMRRQTKVLSDSLEKQKRDSIESSIATAKQLALLQGQLSQQQNTMKLDERAWLGVKEITISHPLAVGQDIDFGVNAVNTGKTPAVHVVLRTLSIGTNESHPDVAASQPGESVVAPNGSEVFYGQSKSPSRPLIEALLANTTRIYVKGVLSYQDIFKRHHMTSFCAYYPTGATQPNFYNCKNGNDMD